MMGLWFLLSVALIGFVCTAKIFLVLWRWWCERLKYLEEITLIKSISVDYISDIIVPDKLGEDVHLDYILFTPRGLLVIDFRDISGNLFCSDQMSEWTIINGAHRSTFSNPQNYMHNRVAAVNNIASGLVVEGRVVFSRRVIFPKGVPSMTVPEANLARIMFIGDQALARLSVVQWLPIWERIKMQLKPSPMGRK